MKTEYILAIAYAVLGLINTYCFLFQRTARKIRQFAVGTQEIGIENKMLPGWYFNLLILSYLRYIPLIWLFFINWKIAVLLIVINWILNIYLPVNDSANIKKLKRNLFLKRMNGTFNDDDRMFESWIIMAEIEIIRKSK